jgi:anti-anti-sigma factor
VLTDHPGSPTRSVIPEFHVAVHPNREQVVVAPRGELDLASLAAVERQLDDLRDVGFADIVVDLRGVTFLDSSGLQLLLAASRQASASGCRFRLVQGDAAVQRLLEITGTTEAFEFVERQWSRGA